MVKVHLKKRKKPYITLKAYLHSRKISYRKAAAVLGIGLNTFSLKINGQSDFTIQDTKNWEVSLTLTRVLFSIWNYEGGSL